MRFGIFTFSRAPYAEIARHFRTAEELGFVSAWVNDDLMVPDYADFEPRPPLVVAAHGDRALRVTARYADGWNTLGGQLFPAGLDPAQRLPSAEAVSRTRQLGDRLDDICAEIGRDPATIQRSVLALCPNPDPFSSLDAFDEYVGGYEAIGIGELMFYWPPIEYSYGQRSPVPAELQARFERIAAARIARL
jgi:alkanesulfonate monooxygenase SsuD/methylene tetrahydromethanopterin reductase-like flavin-dependent oxidoreductase (luciferase family)